MLAVTGQQCCLVTIVNDNVNGHTKERLGKDVTRGGGPRQTHYEKNLDIKIGRGDGQPVTCMQVPPSHGWAGEHEPC